MKRIEIVLAPLLLWFGCTATQETETAMPRQVLVKVSSLPAYGSRWLSKDMSLQVAFRVLGDGTIADVQVLQSAADAEWNTTAAELMKQWRFSPIPGASEPEGRWIQYSLVVHVEEPVMMTLGEIACPTRQESDSLYALLAGDVPFSSIPKERATLLGSVDIAAYPQHVRDVLRKLRISHFTRPLRLGNNYVIYMRFEDQSSKTMVQ